MNGNNQISRSDLGLFLIRAMVGTVFLFHGSQKLFGWFGGGGISGTAQYFATLGIPFPTLNVVLAGSAEFFGGLVLLLGSGLVFAAVPLVITMLVASFTAHSGFSILQGGMEYSLTLAFVVAGLGLTGPGIITIGRVFEVRPAVNYVNTQVSESQSSS